MRAAARLVRPAQLAAVLTGVLAAASLAGGPRAALPLALVAAAMALAFLAQSALRDGYEAPLDAVLRPQRPIPVGAVSQLAALSLGYGALAGSVLLVAATGPAVEAPAVATILAGVIVLLVTLPDASGAEPVLFGLCRALLYVTVAVAVSGGLNAQACFGAAVIAVYAAAVTALADGREQRFWPFVLLLLPFMATLPLLGEDMGHCALWFFALAWVTRWAIAVLAGERGAAVKLAAAACLLDALLIALFAGSSTAWTAAAGMPLALLLGRLFPDA